MIQPTATMTIQFGVHACMLPYHGLSLSKVIQEVVVVLLAWLLSYILTMNKSYQIHLGLPLSRHYMIVLLLLVVSRG